MQDFGTNAGDFDDDEGGGLVSNDARNATSFFPFPFWGRKLTGLS